MIQSNRVVRGKVKSLKIPLWSIVRCRSIWALILTSMSSDYGFYLLLTEGPNFLRNVLKKDITEARFPYMFCDYFGNDILECANFASILRTGFFAQYRRRTTT